MSRSTRLSAILTVATLLLPTTCWGQDSPRQGGGIARWMPATLIFHALTGDSESVEREPLDQSTPTEAAQEQNTESDTEMDDAGLALEPDPAFETEPASESEPAPGQPTNSTAATDPPVEFVYDASIEIPLPSEPALEPVDAPTTQPVEQMELPDDLPVETITEEAASEPTAKTPTMANRAMPVDPFFGGIQRLLGATPNQPYFPRGTICPPAKPKFVNGTLMALDTMGTPTMPMEQLSRIENADLLVITTNKSDANSPGKVVLLADGRALLLKVTDWKTGEVSAKLPSLMLRKPEIARVYLANAAGIVIDAADFVLVPTAGE